MDLNKLKGLWAENKKTVIKFVIPSFLFLITALWVYKSNHSDQSKEVVSAVNTEVPVAYVDDTVSDKNKATIYDDMARKEEYSDQFNTGTQVNTGLPSLTTPNEPVTEQSQVNTEPIMMKDVLAQSQIGSKKQSSYNDEYIPPAPARNYDYPVHQAEPNNAAVAQQTEKEQTKVKGFNTASFGGSKGGTSNIATGSFTIKAVVQNEATVVNGSLVHFRITEEKAINGITIKRNKIVTGVISVGENRVNVQVPGDAIAGELSNQSFRAFDMDGIEGLKVETSALKNQASSTGKTLVDEAGQVVSGYGGRVGQIVSGIIRGTPDGSGKVIIPDGYKITLRK